MKTKYWLLGAVLGLAFFASCQDTLPPPSPDEIKERDYWASKVTPLARQDVVNEAQRHTNWSEKRQIQWEIDRYRTLVNQEQHNAHKASSKPAEAPLDYGM